jgi:hypothetical protein
MIRKIILVKEFGENISTRNSIASFFGNKINILKEKEIIIDFKGIKFISRSSAAEYLKLRENCSKELIEKNMSDEIKSMFKLVEAQFRNANFNFSKETPYEIA